MLLKSSGRMLRRLITSAWMPSFSRSSAAFSECCTPMVCETMVMSLPERSILALPIGSTKSSESDSGVMGKEAP